METLTLQERLLKIQTELKAPKNKYNAFGKYNYRNLEGILEASKPLLLKYGVNLILSDETIEVAGFPICNAKAKIFCSDYPELSVEVQAQAGIDQPCWKCHQIYVPWVCTHGCIWYRFIS